MRLCLKVPVGPPVAEEGHCRKEPPRGCKIQQSLQYTSEVFHALNSEPDVAYVQKARCERLQGISFQF